MNTPPSTSESTEARDAALDDALRGLHREVLSEPVPSSLKDAARRLDALRHQKAKSWHRAAMAAGVFLAFGVGWLARGQLQAPMDSPGAMAQVDGVHEFVRQAGFAHAVYQPEKRHPVEVAATEQDHLVQWLSKRTGKALKIPQLDALGFTLVGGRLLPGDAGARAQFMFEDMQGKRVTLYLGALKNASKNPSASDTQFRFEPNGPVPSFYWSEQGFGYALSGQLDKAMLMALSRLVYGQINR
jgi:anti-sigma factor RsiW